MKKLFLLLIVLCSLTVAQAQVVSAYTMQATQGTYTEITDGTVMNMTGLDLSVEAPLTGKVWYPSGIVAEETTAAGFPIGFDFTFNDIECNQFIIGAHGYIALGRDEINIDPSHNQHIVIKETAADNIIGVMPNVWDIYLNDSTEFSYKVIGEAPNRTLVVQFKNWAPCFGWDAEAAVSMNMQLRLNETSNTIEFVLGDIASGDYTKSTRFALRGYYDDVISLTNGEEDGMLNWVAIADDNQVDFGKDIVTSGITFTFTPPADCAEPVEGIEITDLIPTTNSFSVMWKKVADADHILLLLSESYILTQEPANGEMYHENDNLGNAIVLAYTTDTIYEPWDLVLESSTEYYIHMYAANSYCSNGPIYGGTNAIFAGFKTKPSAPKNITVTDATLNTLTFDVETNGTDDVLVILADSITPNPPYASIIEFGKPNDMYNVGDIIDGTGRVVYIGPSAEGVIVEGLEAGTDYYLRAHSYNDDEVSYSTEVVESSCITISKLPWTVDLSSCDKQTIPVGWTSTGTSQKLLATSQQSGYGEESMQFYVQIAPNVTDGHMIELTSPKILVDKEDALLSLEYNMHIWQRFGGNLKYDEWDERDTFAVQVSRNGGEFETLTELNSTNNVKVDTVVEFTPVFADLSGYYNDTIQVRIYWNCYSNQKVRLILENWNIDDVVIPEVTVKEITSTTAKVEWLGAQDNYEVALAKTDEEFNTTLVEGAKALELKDLEVETEYQVKVRGIIDEEEYSYWSEVVTFKTAPMPECDAPTNLNAIVDGQTATLTWEGTEDHLTWEVRYRDANSTTWTNIEDLEEATLVLEDLEAEVTYLWNVRALCTAERETAWSAQGSFTTQTAVPAVPAAPVVSAYASNDTVHLSWEAVEGALYYTLYYDGKQLGPTFVESAVDIQVIEPGEYCFTITASNDLGESEHSNVACATIVVDPDLKAPEAPVLTAKIENDSVVLTWGAVELATYYNVYFEDKFLGSTTDLELKLGLQEPGTYCFTVTASNLAGESSHSNQACVDYGTGIDETETVFNIYPNPVNDKLYIETEANVVEVVVYDVYGRQQSTANGQQSIDVAGLNSGVYFVKVVTDNGETVKRFVKK